MKSIFNKTGSDEFIERINNLKADTKGKWGKMEVSQMLAHCAYAFEDNSPRPKVIARLLIRFFAKSTVVGKKPYKRNMKTSPAFIVKDKRDFETERTRLIKGIEKVQGLGEDYFNNRKHPVFGRMNSKEWNNFFSKHLDHHLKQFGV
ncbi:DUF1569 domain-containing protein [Leptobacterium flavescens]|uniref:DUF1569 domain-containing protein n=1 Tax=Leptobacterium flavescens TaxID=472055 RepID=A0A6P0US54_9FLAO|nr:DUF1569 domain-containing protein [Leptobacterium flavescens]NER14629.1 DUF1569 domain-containing protein [Leptobacterium flavescens]